jgi:hypothetical protein
MEQWHETLHRLERTSKENNDKIDNITKEEWQIIIKEIKDIKEMLVKISLNQSDTFRFITEFCNVLKKDNNLLRSIIKITGKEFENIERTFVENES